MFTVTLSRNFFFGGGGLGLGNSFVDLPDLYTVMEESCPDPSLNKVRRFSESQISTLNAFFGIGMVGVIV